MAALGAPVTLLALGYRQRLVRAQAGNPGLHLFMRDTPAGIHIGQRGQGAPLAFLFLIDPGGKRLLDDPAA